MRELTSTVFSIMWSGWISSLKAAATTIYPDDTLAATFDAVQAAGDNMQRGIVDLVAGLVTLGAGEADLQSGRTRCATPREEFC